MSKVSFRARALDSNKPLPLYYEEELPDLSEYVAINRTVPQMPTGMEKEEESESHLQKVINARQNLKDTSNLVIPIPEAAIPVSDHQTIYKKSRNQSNTYIRMPGLGPDEELPEYDLDSEDEEWLSVQSRERPLSPIHFERMMDRLEKGSGNTVLSDRDAQVLLKDDEDLVMAVYDYWLAKRLRLSRPLIPSVKNERREGTSSSNPYLAFRKRTEKMQTRKNRKNDEQAYMHMLKLKRDLTRSVTLIDLVKEREQRKYDNALIQAEIFRKRYLLEDWSGNLISSLKPHGAPTSTGRRLSTPDNKWDNKGMRTDYYDDDGIIPLSNRTKKKRRKGPMYTPAMIDNESPLATVGLSKSDKEIKDTDKIDPNEERIDVEELDGPFTFRRKIHLHYHKSGPFNTLPWDSCDNDLEQSLPSKKARFCFSRTSLCGRRLGFSRRRTGRGGRSIWDFVPESYVQQESKDSLNIITNGIRDIDSDTFTSSCTTPELPLPPDSSDIDKHQSRCPHFYPASPKSTSFVDFEFTYLPFVDPSSYSCPELHKGYSQFAGQTLNDDEEGVSSFSLLPTSQFTLRPCINPDQSNDPVSDSQVGENVDPLEEQSQNKHIHGDEVVWKKFRQSEPDSKTDPVSVSDQSSNSSTVKVTPLLTVPSTHLSSLESGLPIQIHVDNLMHLPKKDQKVTIPNTLSLNKTLSSSSSSHPSPSLNSVPSTNITANTDTGVTPGQSLSTKPQPNKEAVTWFKDCPSSNILLLNNCSRQSNSGFSRFRCALPPSIAKSITTRFKTDAKSDPLSSVVTSVSHSLSSSLLPRSLLSSQHQIVNSLISDPKKLESFVKDKRQIVTHPGNHHQNSSPNGTAKLELKHTGKLSLDATANKDIKHTLAARSVMNNHNSLIEGSSGNVLVKLSSGTSPSEVT